MTAISLIAEKVSEVKEEMKRVGLWSATTPVWVLQYGKRSITTSEGFCEWLQFIYLPNRKTTDMVMKNKDAGSDYIAPQASRFFSEDIKRGKLLQLLIELDSL